MDILKDWDLIIRFKKHFLFHTLYYQAKRAPVWEQSLAKDLRRSLKGFRSDSGGKDLQHELKRQCKVSQQGGNTGFCIVFLFIPLVVFFLGFVPFSAFMIDVLVSVVCLVLPLLYFPTYAFTPAPSFLSLLPLPKSSTLFIYY